MLKKDNGNWNIGSLFLDSYRVFRYSGKFWIDDFSQDTSLRPEQSWKSRGICWGNKGQESQWEKTV